MGSVEEMMCVVCASVSVHSGDGCDLASTLCKYDLRKGDLIVLSWARVRRVRRGSISSELLMCGGGVRSMLLPLMTRCLEKVKDELRECTVMPFYDPHMHTTLVVDGSPFGLVAVLTQDGKQKSYASRSLTAVEKRYSRIVREALAIVFGCEHFHMYLIGCKFNIVTDHKHLLNIWNKISPPLRIERWGL